MKVVQPEFKILRVSKSVSLPFEGFDFVDQALDGTAGNAMIEEVEKSGAVPSKSFTYFFEGLDPRVHGVSTPDCEKLLGLFTIRLFPKESQLFLHRMNLEQRAVDLEKSIESGFAVRFKRIVITQEQETASF